MLQKIPAPEFTVTTRLDISQLAPGVEVGLVILGGNYSFVGIEKTVAGARLIKVSGGNHESDVEEGAVPWAAGSVFLRVTVTLGPSCEFRYSADGKRFTTIGKPLAALQAVGPAPALACSARDLKMLKNRAF